MTTTTIATTIKQQIGTDAWLAVSAREAKFWTADNGTTTLAFRFGDRYGLPKWCEITYRPGSDDYSIHAYKIHRNGCRKTLRIASEYEPSGYEYAEYEGVYADSLGMLVRYANQIAELS